MNSRVDCLEREGLELGAHHAIHKVLNEMRQNTQGTRLEILQRLEIMVLGKWNSGQVTWYHIKKGVHAYLGVASDKGGGDD